MDSGQFQDRREKSRGRLRVQLQHAGGWHRAIPRTAGAFTVPAKNPSQQINDFVFKKKLLGPSITLFRAD